MLNVSILYWDVSHIGEKTRRQIQVNMLFKFKTFADVLLLTCNMHIKNINILIITHLKV